MRWTVRWILQGSHVSWEVGYRHGPNGVWCAEGLYQSLERARARAEELNSRQQPWNIYTVLARGAAADN
jgi:hypothetical protein